MPVKKEKRLLLQNGQYTYFRRPPKIFADVEPRKIVFIRLGTGDLNTARRRRDFHDRELEALWTALKRGTSTDARERYLAAIERAKLEGYEFRSIGDLAAGDFAEIMGRLNRLEELYPGARSALSPAPDSGESIAAAGLLGTAIRPELTLSKACEEFFALTKSEVRKKSPDQLRKWKNVRTNAISNFMAIDGVGDKPVSQVSRQDALAFRAWWVDRVVDQGYSPNAANKNIGHVSQILERLNIAFELGLDKPLAGLRLPDDQGNKRSPFSVEQLREIDTEPRHLAGLNPEARGVVLAMIETGMRPIEICSLDETTIVLDHPVPHVSIEPSDSRELKTTYSRRKIPLVGVSLKILRDHPRGFPTYRDKSSNLSALVNPYLQRRGLLPTPNHSLYSIRHTFKDRLRAAQLQDEMMDELMGHKNPRPSYGQLTLEQKLECLLRIAITTAPDDRDQMRLL